MSRRTRVLVLGGGPAGLATAVAASSRGLDVELLERFHPPIDKPCGEGILPAGLAALARLGIPWERLAGHDLSGIRYVDGDLVVEGRFGEERAAAGVRRPVLHQVLAERAEEVGVRARWGCVARGIRRRAEGWSVETSAGELTADWLVGADGLLSHVRDWAGLAARPGRWRRFGVRRHFRVAPWSPFVEVYWGSESEAYVTPVARDLVGVALLWSGSRGGFDRLLRGFPALQARLAGAEVASRDRGAGPFHQRARRVAAPRLALVGDAAGYRDAITGEGLGLAFQEAEALGEALAGGDLSTYVRAHRKIVRDPDRMTRLTLLLARSPRLRRRVLAAMKRDPRLFECLLGVLDRRESFARTGLRSLALLASRAVLAGSPRR